MRKNKNFALGTAALLLSTAGFTACSSEDAFTGSSLSGEAVKTQFAINIPTSGVKGRMSAENTQNSDNFLGMHNIQLIPMTTDAATTGATFSSVVNLGNIGNSEFANSSTKVYTDVNVPVGTTRFLFYGAGNTEDPADVDGLFAKGILDQQINGSAVSDISFSLRPAKVEDTGNQQGTLRNALNAVITAFGKTYIDDAAKDTPDTQLGTLCKKFTQLTAGSAESIKQTLEALSNALAAISGTEATAAGDIKDVVDAQKKTIEDGKLTYPANINMPDGAAVVKFSGEEFAYVSGSIGNAGTVNLPLDMGKVCYPASIYYFVNTPLWATNDSKGTTGWPTSSNWVGNSFFTDWGPKVLSTTHTIALANPIQYGVAQLALTAKCSGSLLEDNKKNKVSVPADGYTITGVLIGGQPDKAGWDFTPTKTTETAPSFTQVVYDKEINGTVAAKSGEAKGINYTLVLDNDNNADDASTQNVVNIAVEFKNTGAEFYGANGQVIPAGAKFYLIAQLNPAGKTTVENYQGTPHVFIQDYTTTANLTITSLANAYNTIPDLRASELSLGLTVDLKWTNGIKFDVDFN